MLNLADRLKTELKERQQRNPQFSLRSFARWLDLSPAQLSQIMSGKRKVTAKTLTLVSDRLGLSPVERLQLMQASMPGFVDNDPQDFRLSEDQFRMVAEWYHWAILSLTQLPGAQSDPRWIARRLGISVAQAQEALVRLQRLELIETAPKFKQTSKPIRVASQVGSDAIRSYHKQNLNLAIEKIDTIPMELRQLHSITMPADPHKLAKANQYMDEFLSRMSELMGSGKPSEIYTLAIQLFPVSHGDQK